MRERVPSPLFSGNRPPSTDFEAVRDGHRSILLQYGPIDLSVARSIAAGTALLVPISGNIFYSDPYIDITSGLSLSGNARIHFQDVANQQSPFLTAQPTSLFKVPFTQLLVENAAQAGKFLLIGYGTDLDLQPGISSQVQASIISSVALGLSPWIGKNRTGSPGFVGFQDATAPGAGLLRSTELWNPVGSGVNLYVDRVRVRVQAAGALISVARHNAALAGLTGNGSNKTLNVGAASKAEMRIDATAGGPGTAFSVMGSDAVGGFDEFDYEEPIIVQPGNGLVVVNQTANQGFSQVWEWREV